MDTLAIVYVLSAPAEGTKYFLERWRGGVPNMNTFAEYINYGTVEVCHLEYQNHENQGYSRMHWKFYPLFLLKIWLPLLIMSNSEITGVQYQSH